MTNGVKCCRDKREQGVKKCDEYAIFHVGNSGSSKVVGERVRM